MCNLDDRETAAQISENMYMQYFLGYSSFSPEPPFDASLFVEFRTRMGLEQINAINEKIHALHKAIVTARQGKRQKKSSILFSGHQCMEKSPELTGSGQEGFLKLAQSRNKKKAAIRRAVGKQLRYLSRNLKSIDKLLDQYSDFPLKAGEQKYLMVIHTLYQQQKKMFDEKRCIP